MQHVEGQSIVGLITRPVGDLYPGRETELFGHRVGDGGLIGEGGYDGGNQTGIEAVVVEQRVRQTLVLKVPQDAFGETGDGGLHLAGEFHGDVVAG